MLTLQASYDAPLPIRAPGGVVLLSCYEMGLRPLALLAARRALAGAGFSPVVIDTAIQPLDEGVVSRARLVAISVPMHTALRLGVRCARRVRRANPNCHIAFYGLYAVLNKDYLVRTFGATCYGGEFEPSLIALARLLDETPGDPGAVAAGTGERPSGHDGLPSLSSYARLEHRHDHYTVGYVAATRGCKHVCLHCPLTPVYGGRFRAVRADLVVAEVRALVAEGARHITFADPDFLNGPTHAARIARRIHDEMPDVTFDFTAKVSHLLSHRELVCELETLGCLFVVSALESLSDRTLANLDKGHTRDDAFALVRFFREIGLTLRPSFVPFTPWDTIQDYSDLLTMVESEGLIDNVDPVQFSIRLLVPPGSALLGTPQMTPHLGPLDEAMFSYEWRHPDPRMDALHKEVGARVARAAEEGEDAALTFYALQRRVAEMMGQNASGPAKQEIVRRFAPDRTRAPRLTEPWFC